MMKTKAEVWIPLTQGKVAVIDFEDFEKVRGVKWHLSVSKNRQAFYARSDRRENGKRLKRYLHRVIWGEKNIPPGFEIGHKDGDGLNCRHQNLSCLTHRQNGQGKRKKRVGATSQYRGVCWLGREKKWCAQLEKDGKHYRLGIFSVEEAAARAYDVAALTHFGEHAAPNFPTNEPSPME